MQLHFLGQIYQPAPQQLETLPSEQQATFRGKNYTLRHPVARSKPEFKLGSLKHRGVTY